MKKNILDKGYIKLVEHWGSDSKIIEAARMSTNKGFLGWGDKNKPGDEKLLKYLWDNKHATPFEMAGLIIEVKAPIMVFREWHRHRTQSYNEMSARYIPLPNEDYIPTTLRTLLKGMNNKQASKIENSQDLTLESAKKWRELLLKSYEHSQQVYEKALNLGVPKELARLSLPVARYSKMRASANLRNWLGFLTLRMDVKAQWEIRQYANALGSMIAEIFPRTWELFLGEDV